MHAPVKTQCFAHFGISCELGKKKNLDERHMQHVPVKTQGFYSISGISWKSGNRKNWDERHMQHLPVEYTIFFGVISKKLRIREGKIGTGDRQEAFTCDKPMFCAMWKKISSMQSDVPATGIEDQKV